MRSIEAIERAIREIDEKVSGNCPNDPFFYACEPDVRMETDKGEFFIDRDGTIKVELY